MSHICDVSCISRTLSIDVVVMDSGGANISQELAAPCKDIVVLVLRIVAIDAEGENVM